VASIGPGPSGGGPLFADGTAGDGIAISIGHGTNVERYLPKRWSMLDAETVWTCFTVLVIQPKDRPDASFCTTLPVSERPVVVEGPGCG
jgi:hypothetical protein